MKSSLVLVALGVSALAVSACSAWPTSQPPGEYKKTETSVDKYGTKTTTSKDTTVYRDADGNKRAVEQTTTTRDPEGLFNKSKSTTTKSYN
jgi:hypothetical protein